MKLFFNIRGTTVIGMGITLLVLLAYFWQPALLRFMRDKSMDLKFQTRGKMEPGPEVVIAAIDEKSLDELGRWPWSRDIQAALLRQLRKYQARVVAFDVLFSEPDTNPGLQKIRDFKNRIAENPSVEPMVLQWLDQVERESDTDLLFATELQKSGNAILGYFFHFTQAGVEHMDQEFIKRSFYNIIGSNYNAVRFSSKKAKDVVLPTAYAAEASITLLAQSAAGAGFFSFITEEDGAIRKMPLIVSHKKMFFPPLSIQALRLYLNEQMLIHLREFGVDRIQMGDLSIPADKEGRFFINYYGPQNTFPHYSIADILNDRIPTDQLKDRIILIGPTAFGIYDLRMTPFQTNFPGVEIHATVIDNILHKRFIIRPHWADMVDLSAIFLLGALFTFFLSRTRVVYSLLGTVALGTVFIVGNYFIFLKGFQISMVYPLLNLLLTNGGITLYRYFTEQQEKRFIKSAFGQYLSPAVIDELIANPDHLKLGGERKVLTAFFSDVAGFSTISEKLSPEELVELLNIYLTEMTNILMTHGGTVDKFEGDAIIAFFGAPVSFEDHARRACLAALEMQQRLAELRLQWKREGRPELHMRIGLNTGPMVVGNMGSKSRMDYTMMGDSVNLASRLEGVNKQYSTVIMTSEYTFQEAGPEIIARKLDSIRVVGKKEPVIIYELVGVKAKVPDSKLEIIKIFEQGLSHYQNQHWEEAIQCFREVLHRDERDGPAMTFLERCLDFQASPPIENWDGVYAMREK